ncbi:MAG: methylenetetrahydrofolate reductase [Geminicoccaceae bacterium]|nr:methylenetetrahydrofolate reductase [Geminicoccaceae bacterium]MCX8099696.1 methylenetetrahydrofolate reductase [Geminicoccaceae bacterium]MDW8369993.1 methylenetetrahydrofolate reductase [Geminicoccaceae bacterium]
MSGQASTLSKARAAGWLDEPLPPVQLSIEVFPPKGPEAAARLWQNLELFVAARPRFVSVTCGAGGSGEVGTYPLAVAIQERFGVPVAAHLTCASASRAEVDALLARYRAAGITRIVALRGDPPKGSGPYRPRPDAYPYAVDLVRAIAREGGFEISVAGYPEVHPEAPSAEFDLDNLKRKVEAGAVRIITQYCFDTDRLLRFRDAIHRAGIASEFVPGIMPIHSFAQIRRFSEACGASIPTWLADLFDGVAEGSAVHGMIAATVVAEQVRRLAAEGIGALHVYALNRAELPLAIVQILKAARTGAAR